MEYFYKMVLNTKIGTNRFERFGMILNHLTNSYNFILFNVFT